MIRQSLELCMLLSRRVWSKMPTSLRRLPIGEAYGRYVHWLVCRYSKRNQNHSTFFMRNRPEMELMCRLLRETPRDADVAIAVLACSKGAEVYSIVWSIRSARPDLNVSVQAIDISQEIIDFAKEGAYSVKSAATVRPGTHSDMTEEERLALMTCKHQGPDQSASIFERLNKGEINAMFDVKGPRATVKPWLKTGITWQVGDACAGTLLDRLPPQDIVVANRFLCHMDPAAAESCLRNVARLVKPGGYLFVSGVDLAVRSRVAQEMGWKPVPDLIQEVYEGDPSLVSAWPIEWWGLEPFGTQRKDWMIRYACAFQIGTTASLDHAEAAAVGLSSPPSC